MNQEYYSKLSYRAEIDGLRAIAVISIILYHAKMVFFGKSFFEGGFIGVDIFFVISGYLITRIILSELQTRGSFSFLNFYERRARRILPMLFLVIFVSMPYAWTKLLPLDFVEYAESILASLFFSSNFFFYFSTTDYGSDSALLKPFLHTWSLGIEEQFYLIFPIITVLAFKFSRSNFLRVLVSLSLISLLFAELIEAMNSDLNFYLPFSRFWELAVGSILAYAELNYRSSIKGFGKNILPMLGIFFVLYSIFFFDEMIPHPSFYTLIPIIGVGLIIGFSSSDDLVGKILGSKPFVWVGLISYSAYLWHYPIFAFSRIGGRQLSNYDKLELILLTFILSLLSFKLIERPFRKTIERKSFAWITFGAGLAIILSSIIVIKTNGIATEYRLGFDPKIIDTSKPSYLFGDEGCEEKDALYHNDTQFCLFGDVEKSELDFLLIGDSHAMHSQPLLDKISKKHGLKGAFGGNSGCPPLLGIYPLRGKPHPNTWSKRCFGFNQNGFDLSKAYNIKTVFLIARWDYYVDGSNKRLLNNALNNISDITLEFGDIEKTRQVFNDGITRTFEAYQKLGVKLVVLLQVPHQNTNIKRFLEGLFEMDSLKERKQKFSEASNHAVTRKEHLLRQKIASSKWLDLSLTMSSDNLVIIDPTDEFCLSERCPFVTKEFAVYTYFDHSSQQGFNRLESKFLKAFGIK